MKQIIHLDRFPWIVIGLCIGASLSLLVCLGVNFILSGVRSLKLPENEVLLFTVLFYGSIFFIAHSGVRANMRKNRALLSRNSSKDFSVTTEEDESTTARVRTLLWNAVALVSMAWLTPALVIYWIAPKHPGTSFAACGLIFGLAGATAFLFKSRKQNQSLYSGARFFIGAIAGALAVASFFPVF